LNVKHQADPRGPGPETINPTTSNLSWPKKSVITQVRRGPADGGLVHHHALAFSTLLSSQETSTTPSGEISISPSGATLLIYPVFPSCQICVHDPFGFANTSLAFRLFPCNYLTGPFRLLQPSKPDHGQRSLTAALPLLVRVDIVKRPNLGSDRWLADGVVSPTR
jgi:hypothetical protein